MAKQVHPDGRETFTHMQQQHESEHHHTARNGFLLFGGLTAALAWTLIIVWDGLVSLANHMR